MHSTSLLHAFIAALTFLVLPVASAPQAGTTVVPCDPISKYTTAWFLGNVCKRPPAATCLFYTRGLSRTARIFSKSGGAAMTTIWEMWATAQYRNAIVSNNPLRCIMQDRTLRRQYFASMSESMAIMCDVFATVMDPNPESPREDGIWGQVEFPTLKKRGNVGCVNAVAGVSPDGQRVHDLWFRGGQTCSAPPTGPHARAVGRDSCGIESDDIAAQFDEGGDFEVLW